MPILRSKNKMEVMPENKLLIQMSLPIIISMLVQALYNIVDSIFVAQIDENALTAVSIAFPIQNLLISVANGTGVGINALLSRSLGERNSEKADKAAQNGVFLMLISYIVFMIFGVFFAQAYLESQTDIPAIINYGKAYITIICCFSITQLGQITFERLLQATGKSIYTMISQATGAFVNIILDPILIFGYFGLPKLGVAGAAAATIIGQYVALTIAVIFNLTKNKELDLSFHHFRPDIHIIGQIYSVGLPAIIMQSLASVMTYGINKILFTFSSTAAAVFGVYFKLNSFAFMPVFGLTNGMIPVVSFNYGARHRKRITKTIKLSILYAMSYMLICLALLQTFPEKFLYLFKASENMISIGIPALRIISISFIFAGFCIVLLAGFQALGHGFMSMIVSFTRQIIVLLPCAYFFSKSGVLNNVWWAFPCAEIVSVVLSAVFMKIIYNKTIRDLEP
ncbi:MAG: MATE family efflux transporter [Oscillospiraceae bacterium]|nr:MATE family efflux transporter [Oscillospiraceae bacterium]